MSKLLHNTIPMKPIVVGKAGSAYGVYGWIRVFSFTEKAENIFNYQPWLIKRIGKWQPISLKSWKRHNKDFIAKVIGIENRVTAMFLNNCEIIIDAAQLPSLNSGEYYWKDFLGCEVVTVSGYSLGEIIDLMATGSNDVLIVKAKLKDTFGIQKRLIPFLYGRVIKRIDFSAQIVEVEWDPRF